MNFRLLLAGISIAVVVAAPRRTAARAQEPSQQPAGAPPTKQKPPKPNTDTATQNAPDQPKWDPLRAEKDLEVGQYYMKRGDYDAAIDRFNDAIEAKPGFAIPFRWLAEAEEKKA